MAINSALSIDKVLQTVTDVARDVVGTHQAITLFLLNDSTARRLPRTLAVVGAGVIGLEYASIFAAVGVRVTLIDKRHRLLPFVDAEIIDTLAYQFTEAPPNGIHPRPNVRVRLCPIYACESHPYEQCTHENNKTFVARLKGWAALTDTLDAVAG